MKVEKVFKGCLVLLQLNSVPLELKKKKPASVRFGHTFEIKIKSFLQN